MPGEPSAVWLPILRPASGFLSRSLCPSHVGELEPLRAGPPRVPCQLLQVIGDRLIGPLFQEALGLRVFLKEPSLSEMIRFLENTIAQVGVAPKYLMTDRGTQFEPTTSTGASESGIHPRFGD
jgi:hypothetical protein